MHPDPGPAPISEYELAHILEDGPDAPPKHAAVDFVKRNAVCQQPARLRPVSRRRKAVRPCNALD